MSCFGNIKISDPCLADSQPENKFQPNKVYKNLRLEIKL